MRLVYMKELTDCDVEPPPVVQHVRWRHWYRDDLKSRFYPDDDRRQAIPMIMLPVLEVDDADEVDDANDMDDVDDINGRAID